MTKISELKLGMNEIELKAKVASVSEPRSVRTKYGYSARVATATLEDDTGQISLTLWGEQIEEIGEGDSVEISKGFVREFQGNLQLNVPRDGKIEVVEK